VALDEQLDPPKLQAGSAPEWQCYFVMLQVLFIYLVESVLIIWPEPNGLFPDPCHKKDEDTKEAKSTRSKHIHANVKS